MKAFCLTDTGLVRSHNEDSVLYITKDKTFLLAVADGMGGHCAGEVASSIAISYLEKHFQETFEDFDKVTTVNWIRDTVSEINTLIFQHEKKHPESKGMGTTLVLAIATNEYILFGNIGDSSGLVMKDGKVHKVTYDHTMVNLLVSAGELTKEEAKTHPKKNVLMKALGANDPIDIDIFDCDISVDVLLLCSDGLTNMLSKEEINEVLVREHDAEVIVKTLIDMANDKGGTDNISVSVLIRDKEGEN